MLRPEAFRIVVSFRVGCRRMDVKLLVANEKSKTREVRLGPETVIGRARECNLRIVSGQVSRRHCVIRVENDRVVVRDLGSANGTEVDGATIPPEIDVPVAPGSLLVVGSLTFVFEFNPSGAAEPNEDDLQSTTQDIAPLPGASAAKTIDDTKDYGPSSRRGNPAPVSYSDPDSSGLDFSEGPPNSPAAIVGGAPSVPAAGSTGVTFEETVYDNELSDRAREAAAYARTGGNPLETGTDLMADDSVVDPDAGQRNDATPPEVSALPSPGGEISLAGPIEALEPGAAEPRKGWKFLDFLHRKAGQGPSAAESKNAPETVDPAPKPATPPAAEDPALEDFFKHFEP
jgi:pSer/pThr/pTyr-binding forkhead associated (FHA) protein